MTAAIRASGLGKQYELGTRRRLDPNRTLREALTESTTRALRAAGRRLRGVRDRTDDGEFWALRDLSLEVARGEAIGIIGGNGAGKSTLLKLLSRITAPTTGRIELRGRVGSLLEVGTGFHPDLTGRDNIYLNGAILGMRRAEITRRFDEIVAFAEVDRFVDTPVKRYSSGMYLRLAFAVAAHLEPEVLLVDEVLAVGDAAFQQKCLGKMGDVTAQGRTVLFVSHNLDAVQRLCARSVLLHAGRLVDEGPSADVVRAYLSHALQNPEPGEWVDVSHLPRHGSGEVRFAAVQFASGTELLGGYPHTHGPVEFLLDIVSDAARRISSLAVVIRDQSGANLVNADIAALGESVRLAPGHNVARLQIDALYLNQGEYSIDLWVGEAGGSGFDHVERAFQLRVLDPRPVGTGATPVVTGLVPCGVRADVQRHDAAPPDAAR